MPAERINKDRHSLLKFVAYGAIAILTAFIIHYAVGRRLIYRPILTNDYIIAKDVEISTKLAKVLILPSQTFLVNGQPNDGLVIGKRYRTRLLLTNYMFPPKFAIGAVQRSDNANLNHVRSTQYYFSYGVENKAGNGILPVNFSGTITDTPLREGDIIEAVILVSAKWKTSYISTYWATVEKAVVISSE